MAAKLSLAVDNSEVDDLLSDEEAAELVAELAREGVGPLELRLLRDVAFDKMFKRPG